MIRKPFDLRLTILKPSRRHLQQRWRYGSTGDDTILTEYDAIRRAHLTTPDYTAQWWSLPAPGQGVRGFGEGGNDYAEGGLRDDALDGGDKTPSEIDVFTDLAPLLIQFEGWLKGAYCLVA